MKPTTKNTELASLERSLEAPHRFGAYRIALGFPNSYEIGMSNLGFQWVYRLFNRVRNAVLFRPPWRISGSPMIGDLPSNGATYPRGFIVASLQADGIQ